MTRDPEPNVRGSYRLLAMAARAVQRRQEDALAPLGLTRAAVIALEALASGPLNQEQLAGVVHVQSQTIGRVVARLEGQGLLKRTRNPADRRQFQVELTDAGTAALAAARRAEVDAIPPDVDTESWDVLQEQLARFLRSFQASGRRFPGRSARHDPRPETETESRPEPGPESKRESGRESGTPA